MKKMFEKGFIKLSLLFAGALALVGVASYLVSVRNVGATQVFECEETQQVTKNQDYNGHVNIDLVPDHNTVFVAVSADSGYTITKVEFNLKWFGGAGWFEQGTGAGHYFVPFLNSLKWVQLFIIVCIVEKKLVQT